MFKLTSLNTTPSCFESTHPVLKNTFAVAEWVGLLLTASTHITVLITLLMLKISKLIGEFQNLFQRYCWNTCTLSFVSWTGKKK